MNDDTYAVTRNMCANKYSNPPTTANTVYILICICICIFILYFIDIVEDLNTCVYYALGIQCFHGGVSMQICSW
jgi:hypothetical protein